jgi:soluble lytic murein transglycosylase-like protein
MTAIYLIGLVVLIFMLEKQGAELNYFNAVYNEGDFDPIYRKYGNAYGVDWRLLKAVAIVESNENPNAVGSSDDIGLMQVISDNTLSGVIGWPPESREQLFDPDYNVSIGSQILKWNIDTYGFQKGIAVYNNWSARFDGEYGPFRNETYVDKVLKQYSDLQRSGNGLYA